MEEWALKEGSLPRFMELYRDLLRLQVEAQSRVRVPEPDLAEGAVADKLRQSIPLLAFDKVAFDWALVQEVFESVARVFTEHGVCDPAEGEGFRGLVADTSALQQAVKAWYQGQSLSVIAGGQGISEGRLAAALQAALHPFLAAHAEQWSALVVQELWRRRYCPLCGGKPNLAFLDKESGARWLLCSRCDAQWLFQRLECPFCGTHRQDSLAYFTDGEGLYRLYTCDECRSYIKAIDLRRAESEALLPLERLVTVEMDRQAEEAGYRFPLAETDLLGQLYRAESEGNQQ